MKMTTSYLLIFIIFYCSFISVEAGVDCGAKRHHNNDCMCLHALFEDYNCFNSLSDNVISDLLSSSGSWRQCQTYQLRCESMQEKLSPNRHRKQCCKSLLCNLKRKACL